MIEITRPGKNTIVLDNPVIIAAGMMGFDSSTYRHLLKVEKLGAMVTAPLSWKPRGPARGTRIVEQSSGFLLHTGLPNPGIRKVVRNYQETWKKSPVPIIAHLMDSRDGDLHSAAQILDGLEGVIGIELGLREDATFDDVEQLIQIVRSACELPLTVKLPLFNAPWLAPAAEDFGADALVVSSPPRGTNRDPISGRLVGGRLYGVFLKPLVLRAVGQIASLVKIPIIASGGIHNAGDARDMIDAGATAVQVDTLLWVAPSEVEIIARNLGGLELTREVGALYDEWEPGLGKTIMMQRKSVRDHSQPQRPDATDPFMEPPPPPEMPLSDDENTLPDEDWLK